METDFIGKAYTDLADGVEQKASGEEAPKAYRRSVRAKA